MYDLAVIGGGPAGMMTAIFAARTGAKVAIFEKNAALGLKILATGNGRCNISNSNITKDRYHGSVVSYFDHIYESFDVGQTKDFFSDLGVKLKEEDRGRLFPVSDKASQVVAALVEELSKLDVSVIVGTTVKGISHDRVWVVSTEDQDYKAKAVVLTTGGKAAHRLGSSGDGLFWALNLGHKPTEIYAALVPMETKESFVKEVMGVKMKVSAQAMIDGKLIRTAAGDMLFTHYGISGPAVMGLSGAIAPYIGSREATVSLDFFPQLTKKELEDIIYTSIQRNQKKHLPSILGDLVPVKLAKVISTMLSLDKKSLSEISKTERALIVGSLKSFILTPSKIRPLKEAQVTSGGIPAEEVSSNLESQKAGDLYFAGEILDIDGDSGGFNLQWAWSSGAFLGKLIGGK